MRTGTVRFAELEFRDDVMTGVTEDQKPRGNVLLVLAEWTNGEGADLTVTTPTGGDSHMSLSWDSWQRVPELVDALYGGSR